MHDVSSVLPAIQALAVNGLPGAIVLAEHATDVHMATLVAPHERLAVLATLAGDLVEFGRARPGVASFLGQFGSYVPLLRGTPVAEVQGSSTASARVPRAEWYEPSSVPLRSACPTVNVRAAPVVSAHVPPTTRIGLAIGIRLPK